MTKPIQFDRQAVLNAAFDIFRTEGLGALSVRKIALAAGSSTAPIYSCFSGIDEIREALLEDALDRLIQYTEVTYTKNNFLNTGVGVLELAKQYPIVYRTIFMENEKGRDLFRKLFEANRKQMQGTAFLSSLTEAACDTVLDKLSVYTHGLAALICAGILENTDTEHLIALLDETGEDIIRAAVYRAANRVNHESSKTC